MTERFYTEGRYVMQDGEVYVICNGEHNADVVATALNELLDEIEQLKGEVKRLNCINKQLEGRLGRYIALNMDCGEVDCPLSCSSCKYYRASDNYCYYFNNSV